MTQLCEQEQQLVKLWFGRKDLAPAIDLARELIHQRWDRQVPRAEALALFIQHFGRVDTRMYYWLVDAAGTGSPRSLLRLRTGMGLPPFRH